MSHNTKKDEITKKFMFEAVEQCGRRVLLSLHTIGTFASQQSLSELFTTT